MTFDRLRFSSPTFVHVGLRTMQLLLRTPSTHVDHASLERLPNQTYRLSLHLVLRRHMLLWTVSSRYPIFALVDLKHPHTHWMDPTLRRLLLPGILPTASVQLTISPRSSATLER